MESAAAPPPENPIIQSILYTLKARAASRRSRREEKELKLKCERLAEKWKSVISADPEMKGIPFALRIGSEPIKIVYIGGDDDEVLTKRDLIYDAVFGCLAPALNPYNPDPPSSLREKCRQFARNVSKKIFPSEKVMTNLLKALGKEGKSPVQYIQWLKEAWEYNYPPDKDDS